jgi:Flp pilus assembly protein TadB
MAKPGRLKKRPWTRFEIAFWLSALVVVLTLGTLAVTNVLGPWALMLASLICIAVGLMRYRRETR